MRWLVTGGGGALATDLATLLGGHIGGHTAGHAGERVSARTRAQLDVTDPAAVAEAVTGHDVVVNTAAWTRVDDAETAEEAATAVNGGGARTLAAACAASGAVLLQISTDYVLPGTGTGPAPDDAPTAPVNAYGRSKLAGERAVAELLPDRGYVVRTAWLYGPHGTNFVRTMLRLATAHPRVLVVDDQHGQPTTTAALARQLVALGTAAVAGTAPAGIYHGTATGATTWFGLTRELFLQAGLDPARVAPTTSAAFPRPAPRPANSVLGHDRWAAAGIAVQPHWREQLAAALRTPQLAADAAAARAGVPAGAPG